MYNQIIIDRLRNLNNLYALKKANVTIMSKKNEFGDMVKFFAQINTDNVIQKFSYKATGCTTFVALCSYFCELVEGKSIEKASKINADDLKSFCDLDESKTHAYKIILDTFALLIKKYKKGIQSGKIIPCEIIENNQKTETKNKVKKDNLSQEKKCVEKDLNAILAEEKPKRKKTSASKTKEKTSSHKEVINETTVIKTEIIEKNLQNTTEEIKPTQSDKKIEESSQKLTHLQALDQKIQTKENNDKKKTNTINLNSILNKLNTHKEDNLKKQEVHSQEKEIKETKTSSESIRKEQKNSLSSIRNSLSNLKKANSQSIEKSENLENTTNLEISKKADKNLNKKEKANKDKKPNKVEKSKKEKKSWFSWLKK